MKIITSCLVASLFFLGGCAATVTEAGYYWGDYSQTLYKYTKDPNETTLAAHVEELEDIISTSDEKGLKVPPGIHAELGYIKARQGNDNGKGDFDSKLFVGYQRNCDQRKERRSDSQRKPFHLLANQEHC